MGSASAETSGGQILGEREDAAGGHHDVLREAAGQVHAEDPALPAHAVAPFDAAATLPAGVEGLHADVQARREALDPLAQGIHASGDLVPRRMPLGHHAAVEEVQIAAADPAGLDPHPHLARARLGTLAGPGSDPTRPSGPMPMGERCAHRRAQRADARGNWRQGWTCGPCPQPAPAGPAARGAP